MRSNEQNCALAHLAYGHGCDPLGDTCTALASLKQKSLILCLVLWAFLGAQNPLASLHPTLWPALKYQAGNNSFSPPLGVGTHPPQGLLLQEQESCPSLVPQFQQCRCPQSVRKGKGLVLSPRFATDTQESFQSCLSNWSLSFLICNRETVTFSEGMCENEITSLIFVNRKMYNVYR